jgi:hypothetical protein
MTMHLKRSPLHATHRLGAFGIRVHCQRIEQLVGRFQLFLVQEGDQNRNAILSAVHSQPANRLALIAAKSLHAPSLAS